MTIAEICVAYKVSDSTARRRLFGVPAKVKRVKVGIDHYADDYKANDIKRLFGK